MSKMPVGLKVGDKVVWNIAMQLGARITARAIEGFICALPTPHTAQIEVVHGGKPYRPTVLRTHLERAEPTPPSLVPRATSPTAQGRTKPTGAGTQAKGVGDGKVLRVRRAKNTDTQG